MPKAYLQIEDVMRLEEAAINLRDRLLIRLLFHLGCRVSEALALKVEDVDFEQGKVSIEHLKTKVRLSCPRCTAKLSRSHAFCPKCGVKVEKAVAEEGERRRMRTLPADKETLELLRDYIRRGGPMTRGGEATCIRHQSA